MGKLLFFALVAVAIYFLLGAIGQSGRIRRDRQGQGRNTAQGAGELMVSCSLCGVHVPASQAVQQGTKYFCSEEHKQGRRTD